jgi:anti-anti-sigma factor
MKVTMAASRNFRDSPSTREPVAVPGGDVVSSSILALAIRPDQQRPTIQVAGQLDISSVDSLTDLADQVLARRPAQLLVDLGQVTFFGAAGVSALLAVRAAADAAGAELRLCHLPAMVRFVLDLTATATLFTGAATSNRPDPADISSLPTPGRSAASSRTLHRPASLPAPICPVAE